MKVKMVISWLVLLVLVLNTSISLAQRINVNEDLYGKGYQQGDYTRTLEALLGFIIAFSTTNDPNILEKIDIAARTVEQLGVKNIVVYGKGKTGYILEFWEFMKMAKMPLVGSYLVMEGGLFGVCVLEVKTSYELAEGHAQIEAEKRQAAYENKVQQAQASLQLKLLDSSQIRKKIAAEVFGNYASLPVKNLEEMTKEWDEDRKSKKQVSQQVEECLKELQEQIETTEGFRWLDTSYLRKEQPMDYGGEPFGWRRHFIGGDKFNEFTIEVTKFGEKFGLEVTSYIINIEEAGITFGELVYMMEKQGIKYRRLKGAVSKKAELLIGLVFCLRKKIGIPIRVILEAEWGDQLLDEAGEYYWTQKLQEIREFYIKNLGRPIQSTEPKAELATGRLKTIWELIP